MSTISQRIHRAAMPGYWAVDIRLSAAAGAGRKYLCQAQDEPAAGAIARRLMGSAVTVQGYDCYWIDKASLERGGATLPLPGEHQVVAAPGEWAELMAAHEASELAYAPERGGA